MKFYVVFNERHDGYGTFTFREFDSKELAITYIDNIKTDNRLQVIKLIEGTLLDVLK